jgi:hypothetical protein
MKKLLTLILLVTTFMLVSINTHASGTLITLEPESGTVSTSPVTFDFDGTYLTLNGTYTTSGYQKILETSTSIVQSTFYEIHVTYISGSYTFDGASGTINFGNNQYFRSNPYPQTGESFTQIIAAGQSGAYAKLLNGSTGSGTFTNYVLKIEFFEIPSVTEYAVSYYHGETFKSTVNTVYQTTKAPSSTYETLAGNVFKGWYEDPELTIPHTIGSTISADMNLYAKFVPETNIAQDLTITPTQNGATSAFHLREEGLNAYLVNTDTLLQIDHTLLSQTYEGASTITVSSEKTFYNVMVIEYDGFVEDVYALPTQPNTEEITIWLDTVNSKIRFNHNSLQESIPLNLQFTVYFANYDTFLQNHHKVTYLYDGGSTVRYLNLDEEPLSLNIGSGNISINVWYTDPQFTTLYDFNQIPTGDVTVYGQWIDNTTGEPIENQTPDNNPDPVDPGDTNNPGDPTTPTEPIEDEASPALEFIQKYWFALIILTVMIALLSPTKK